MAADDDERGAAPDPWDEIVAENLGEGAEGLSLRFDEAAAEPDSAASGTDDSGGAAGAGPSAVADGSGAGENADTDALVEDWLSGDEGDADAAPPALAVFPPDDAAAGSSAIDIGTGSSGIGLHGEPRQEEIGSDVFGADGSTGAEEWPGVEMPANDAVEEGTAGGGFPDLAAGVAAAAGAAAGAGATAAAGTAPAKPTRRPSTPAKRKSGAFGQMVGVVLGGLMAIPITLAILIYGLGKDPFGVTKKVPAEVAFLLPEKFRPGFKKPSAAQPDDEAAGPSALDNLPGVNEIAEPVAAGGDEPAAGEPPAAALVDADMPPEPQPEPQPAPAVDELAIVAPGLDELGAPPAPAVAPEPPPLDTAALDEAVGEATALCEALGVAEDRESPAYNKLRTRWYRALARVAAELVAVENEAATSGRPLAAAPDSVAALHGTIGRREALVAELAALAPDWLAYAKRGSDGVVLPVMFESARKVGPYWTARVSLAGPDGTPRDLTVISRSEPIAVTGDRIVVTGVALDGTVVWAADLRGADAGGLPPGF